MSSTNDLAEKPTIVVGASRGLGRGIATAFAQAGAPVMAVARSGAPLADLAAGRATSVLRLPTPPVPRSPQACWTATSLRSWSWSPAPARRCSRCSSRRGRRSR